MIFFTFLIFTRYNLNLLFLLFILLDDSDLNLDISKDFENAKPISDAALSLVWAGARCTYGVNNGKVLYELQITSKNKFFNNFPDEKSIFELRCGFSTTSSNLQLGENALSFAYGSDGKKSLNKDFSDYGTPFGLNDILGVYLNLESNPCTIEYTVNGKSQGIAFEFEKSVLNNEALFPHILSKNIGFHVNFGQIDGNMLKYVVKKKNVFKTVNFTDDKISDAESKNAINDTDHNNETVEDKVNEKDIVQVTELKQTNDNEISESIDQDNILVTDLLEGFEYINTINPEVLISGPRRPDSRKECEVYMMIGLPGAGKTYWAENHAKENVSQHFNILGTNSLLERMTVYNALICLLYKSKVNISIYRFSASLVKSVMLEDGND